MILCHSSFKSDHKQNGFDQFSPSSECVHSFASCSCSYAYVHAPYIYLCVSHARNSKFVRFRSISPAPERRFVVGIGAERRPTVFVMARWFQRIAVKNHTYVFPSSFFVGVFIFSHYVLVVARSVSRRFASKEFSYIRSRYIRISGTFSIVFCWPFRDLEKIQQSIIPYLSTTIKLYLFDRILTVKMITWN